MRELVLAQTQPDRFHRVWVQANRAAAASAQVVRHAQVARAMPTCLVEHDDRMGVGSKGRSELAGEQARRLGRDLRRHEGEAFAFNILKANRTDTLSQDRYRAGLVGIKDLLRMLVVSQR